MGVNYLYSTIPGSQHDKLIVEMQQRKRKLDELIDKDESLAGYATVEITAWCREHLSKKDQLQSYVDFWATADSNFDYVDQILDYAKEEGIPDELLTKPLKEYVLTLMTRTVSKDYGDEDSEPFKAAVELEYIFTEKFLQNKSLTELLHDHDILEAARQRITFKRAENKPVSAEEEEFKFFPQLRKEFVNEVEVHSEVRRK